MASTEPETEGDSPGLGLDVINMAKDTAMNSCNSIKNSLGIKHILSLCISPLIHVIDIGSDANLAYRYYADDEYLYCGLTAFFIAGPTILVSLLRKMYFQDFSPGSILKWIYEMVMMILPISPFLSSFQALNQVKVLKRTVTDFAENPDLDKFDAFQNRLDSVQKEKSSAAMLGVAEGFLKSAPQLVLQITIFLSRAQLIGSVNLYLSLGSSFAATMKAFVGFYNSVQTSKTSRIGTIILYVWASLVITSRVMAISLGVSIYFIETVAICFIHWLGMTMWLTLFESTRYTNPPKPGKLGKLLSQIPMEQLKLETLTKVGTQVKDEALAKVGALASVFTKNEVQAQEENEPNGEVQAQGAEDEAQDEGETLDGKGTQTKGTVETDIEAQEGGKGKGDGKPSIQVGSNFTFKKLFFSSLFGMIYIFVYVSIIEKPTRNKYAFYYFVWFLENCFFLVAGCRELWDAGAWLFLGLRVITFGGVVSSLVIMFFYITFHNPSLLPKKKDASGGVGLETAFQYGLNGLKAIDPTQLIPLKSIDPTQFIPKLDSLPIKLPGTELVSGLIPGKLPDTFPGTELVSGLISGKLPDTLPGTELVSGLTSGKFPDTLPGTELVSGLTSGKFPDTLPGTELVSGLISGKLPDTLPGTELVSGLTSGKLPVTLSGTELVSGLIPEKLPDTLPGAQLISGLIPGTKESLPDTIPGAQLVSGLFSGKEESSPDSIPGAQLINNLISKKDDSSPTTIPGAQLVTGLFSGKEENSPSTKLISGFISKKNDESSAGDIAEAPSTNGLISGTKESLTTAIPGAQLVSGLLPGKEENSSDTIPDARSITGLISGNEESFPSAVPGTQLVSGLFSGKEENSSDTAPATQFISGLISGREESSSSTVPGAQLISGLVSKKEENSSDNAPAPATQFISGLIPGKEEGSFKLWGKK